MQRFLDWMENEVGYIAKRSPKLEFLFDKTANSELDCYFTKYTYLLDTKYPNVMRKKVSGCNWCTAFYLCGIFETYGEEIGMKLLYLPGLNSASAGCGRKNGQRHYIENNVLYDFPQVGDHFFQEESHCGVVTKVENDKFWTIAGNANGGQVVKQGPIPISPLYKFGRPNWKVLEE